MFREKKLTIAIHQGVEGVPLKQIIYTFSTDKHISVEVVELPYEELYDSELNELSKSKSRYDVIMLDDPWLPALIEGDQEGEQGKEHYRLQEIRFPDCSHMREFVPSTLRVGMHPYPDKDPDKNIDTPIECNSTFYALPFVANSQLFALRKDTVTEKPTTWQDVLKISSNTRNTSGYVMRVGPGNQIVTDFMPMLWGVSKRSFRPTGPPRIEGAEQALRYLAELGKMGSANLGVVSYDDFDLAVHLSKGKASMAIVWSAWAMAMAKLPSSYAEQLLSNIEFVPMPDKHPALGAWLLAIPANARHTDRANEFISFATDTETLRKAVDAGNPPPLEKLLNDAKLRADFPSFEAQLNSLNAARPRPRTKHWRKIERAMGECLSRVYESSVDEAEISMRINSAIERIEKNRELKSFNCKETRF
jgi:multiple sugar transport system substrate-binding protein